MFEVNNVKRLALVLVFVGVVTGVNVWLHRDDLPVGYSSFSGYGFSFDYPDVLEYNEWGYPEGDMPVTDFGGCVQVKRLWEGEWRNFWVTWYRVLEVPDLDEALDAYYDQFDSWDLLTYNKGERVRTERDGYEMIVQDFMFYEEGGLPINDFRCMAAAWVEPWPSLRSHRVYLVTYIKFDNASPEEVHAEFTEFMESFDGNTGVD